MNPYSTAVDSERTKADFMALIARKAVRANMPVEQFVAQFQPAYQPLALRAYREAEK